MSFSINQFREQVNARGGFARSHVYICKVIHPLFKNYEKDKDFLFCRSVALPSFSVNTEEIKFFTRSIKFPGARTAFEPARLTFYNTNDFKLRKKFELWNNLLNAFYANVRGGFDEAFQITKNNTFSTGFGEYRDAYTAIEGGSFKEEYLYGKLVLVHFSIEAEVAGLGGVIRRGSNALGGLLSGAGLGGTLTNNLLNAATNIVQGAAVQALNQTDLGRIAQGVSRRLGFDLTPNIQVATYVLDDVFPSTVSGLQYGYDNDGEMQTYDVEFQVNNMNSYTQRDERVKEATTDVLRISIGRFIG